MGRWKLAAGLAAAALAAGCDARIGKEEETAAENGNAVATAKAEEGRVSIKADGVDLSVSIPEGVRDEIKADSDSKILPPGAKLTGMHVQGGTGGKGGNVEMRFRVDQPGEQVAAWYRDAARGQDFTIASASKEGSDTVLSGKMRKGDGDFTVRLAGEGAATQGRITLNEGG